MHDYIYKNMYTILFKQFKGFSSIVIILMWFLSHVPTLERLLGTRCNPTAGLFCGHCEAASQKEGGEAESYYNMKKNILTIRAT